MSSLEVENRSKHGAGPKHIWLGHDSLRPYGCWGVGHDNIPNIGQ